MIDEPFEHKETCLACGQWMVFESATKVNGEVVSKNFSCAGCGFTLKDVLLAESAEDDEAV